MHLLGIVNPLLAIGRGLRSGLFMFWETLWALVLGFALSGAVQAFVPKSLMERKLGNHRPASVTRAAGYGMVSSSCSYAASAMAKSLFAKGADFTTAMVFMIASTNLVLELGIILLVILGWQFMAAEFVGGPVMILLLATLGGFVFRPGLVATARLRINGSAGVPETGCDHGATGHSKENEDAGPTPANIRSLAAWSDAANYAVADFTMLRRELLIGYTVAGMLAALIPAHFWNSLFLHGHGQWTTLENALVGPLIAIISWVCSIGNVPLAAALWSGGISFAGVISFIFADLITMPLILIYRKFYGTPLTLRIVGLFYLTMVIAGLVTQGLFSIFGVVPHTRTITASSSHFSWNYTSYLDILLLVIAIGIFLLAGARARLGGGIGYAIDPICGMQVRIADAPASCVADDATVYFCSDRCHDKFLAVREVPVEGSRRYIGQAMEVPPTMADKNSAIDPVCGMSVTVDANSLSEELNGTTYYFCNPRCATQFLQDPGHYLDNRSRR